MDCMRLQPPQTNLGRAGFVNKNAATLPKTVCDFSELGSDRWLTSNPHVPYALAIGDPKT